MWSKLKLGIDIKPFTFFNILHIFFKHSIIYDLTESGDMTTSLDSSSKAAESPVQDSSPAPTLQTLPPEIRNQILTLALVDESRSPPTQWFVKTSPNVRTRSHHHSPQYVGKCGRRQSRSSMLGIHSPSSSLRSTDAERPRNQLQHGFMLLQLTTKKRRSRYTASHYH